MKSEMSSRVLDTHLKRTAYLYVRQATLGQGWENRESTQRQYDLRQRAMALGWPAERISIIDTDLGKSGASSADREGFQRLVTEVSLGRAGVVMGLETSRLTRNSTDWHQLLEICALTDTLMVDEDGVYDPARFNDRLLLGLKGTMPEARVSEYRTGAAPSQKETEAGYGDAIAKLRALQQLEWSCRTRRQDHEG